MHVAIFPVNVLGLHFLALQDTPLYSVIVAGFVVSSGGGPAML